MAPFVIMFFLSDPIRTETMIRFFHEKGFPLYEGECEISNWAIITNAPENMAVCPDEECHSGLRKSLLSFRRPPLAEIMPRIAGTWVSVIAMFAGDPAEAEKMIRHLRKKEAALHRGTCPGCAWEVVTNEPDEVSVCPNKKCRNVHLPMAFLDTIHEAG